MYRVSTYLLAAIMFVVAGLSVPASAAPITGYSTGTFSDNGCVSGIGNCTIIDSGRTFWWGWTETNGTNYNSYLKILENDTTNHDYDFNHSVPADDLVLAGITWIQNYPYARDAWVTWNVNIVFTDPVNGGDASAISLNIDNRYTWEGSDFITLGDLSGLVFNLPGYVVSDLKYVGTGFDSATRKWTYGGSPQTLYIAADFTATSVPEPSTMLLLGLGLVGLAGVRRKMKK